MPSDVQTPEDVIKAEQVTVEGPPRPSMETEYQIVDTARPPGDHQSHKVLTTDRTLPQALPFPSPPSPEMQEASQVLPFRPQNERYTSHATFGGAEREDLNDETGSIYTTPTEEEFGALGEPLLGRRGSERGTPPSGRSTPTSALPPHFIPVTQLSPLPTLSPPPTSPLLPPSPTSPTSLLPPPSPTDTSSISSTRPYHPTSPEAEDAMQELRRRARGREKVERVLGEGAGEAVGVMPGVVRRGSGEESEGQSVEMRQLPTHPPIRSIDDIVASYTPHIPSFTQAINIKDKDTPPSAPDRESLDTILPIEPFSPKPASVFSSPGRASIDTTSSFAYAQSLHSNSAAAPLLGNHPGGAGARGEDSAMEMNSIGGMRFISDIPDEERKVLNRRTMKLQKVLGEALPEGMVETHVVDAGRARHGSSVSEGEGGGRELYFPSVGDAGWDFKRRSSEPDVPSPTMTEMPRDILERTFSYGRGGKGARLMKGNAGGGEGRKRRTMTGLESKLWGTMGKFGASSSGGEEQSRRLGNLRVSVRKESVVSRSSPRTTTPGPGEPMYRSITPTPTSPSWLEEEGGMERDREMSAAEERVARRRQLAKLHRLLGQVVPAELLLTSVHVNENAAEQLPSFMHPVDPNAPSSWTTRLRGTLTRKSISDDPQEGSTSLWTNEPASWTTREKQSAVKKASKMKALFGEAPPVSSYLNLNLVPGSSAVSCVETVAHRRESTELSPEANFEAYRKSLLGLGYLLDNNERALTEVLWDLQSGEVVDDSSLKVKRSQHRRHSSVPSFGSSSTTSLYTPITPNSPGASREWDPNEFETFRRRAMKLTQLLGDPRAAQKASAQTRSQSPRAIRQMSSTYGALDSLLLDLEMGAVEDTSEGLLQQDYLDEIRSGVSAFRTRKANADKQGM